MHGYERADGIFGSIAELATMSESSPLLMVAIETQSYFCGLKGGTYVSSGMKISGEQRATTLPTSMGVFAPVDSMEISPAVA